MKRIIYSLSLALLFPLLTSCGKEDVKPDTILPAVQASQINGQWFAVKASIQLYSGNGYPSGTPKLENMTGHSFTFSGSTGYSDRFQTADTTINNPGTYSLSSGLLNIQPGKWVVIKPDLYIVDTLNAHRLVFHLKNGMPNGSGGVLSITYTAKR